MVKDSVDFEYSYNQVKAELDLEDMKEQELLMDSKSFNKTFETMENSLNKLYEKSRYLEGMMKYCKTFLSVKIDEYTQDTKAILSLIEDVRDINKNLSYIEYPITLTNSTYTTADRDGNTISQTKLQNNFLILSNAKEETIDYTSCSKKSKSIPYKHNLEDIKTDFYTTTYIERDLIKGGMIERITVSFKAPQRINNINIVTSNAEVKNISYIYLNGVEEQQEKLETGFTKDRTIVRISFDLICTNYKNSVYKIDKDKMTDHTWDKLKEYEYSYLNNLDNKLAMEEFIEVNRNDNIIKINDSGALNTVNQSNFSYVFGIDKMEFKYVEPNTDSCFISKDILVGDFKKGEYVNVFSEFSHHADSGIEFSIVDGDIEIPLIPSNSTYIENEKIFKDLNLRFSEDSQRECIVKNNGFVTNIDVNEAIAAKNENYSASYYSYENLGFSYRPMNKNIKVKAVIRRYNNLGEMPYIKNIKIRKFGGASPWIENL